MNRERMGKILSAVVKMALATLFLGGVVMYLALWSSLSGQPVYVTRTILWAGGAAVIALCLLAGGFLGRRGRRLILGALLAVCLAAGVYVGHGVWRDSLPSMSDRDLLLWQYQPFAEDTKAVRLEEESTLRFTKYQRLKLDGATALYPVYAAFVQAVYPEGEYDRYSGAWADSGGIVACTGTVDAYERLIDREVDLIFCAAPSQEQRDAAEAAGMEPTKDTIRDGSYPISSSFYAVTAAPKGIPDPRETRPDLAAFLDWILSPQGQELVERTGYVALD